MQFASTRGPESAPDHSTTAAPGTASETVVGTRQHVLGLQRMAGNAATTQLIQQRTGSVQRRVVYAGLANRQVRIATLAALVDRVRRHWTANGPHNHEKFPEFATIGQTFSNADIQAVATAANYLTSPDELPVGDVSEEIYRTLINRHFAPRTVKEGMSVLPGVKAAVLEATATTTGHRASTTLPSPSLDFHAPDITFFGRIGIDGSAEAVQGWQIGVTQTVLQVQRRFLLRSAGGPAGTRVFESTTTLGAPTNDRNAGVQAPWYSEYKALTPGTTFLDVGLFDKPGEEFNAPQGGQFNAVVREGSDRFGTWIILWHPATNQARFLGKWTWTVDYNDASGTRLQVSPFTSLVGASGPQSEAVLQGARCRDVLVSPKPVPSRRPTLADNTAFTTAAQNDRTRVAFERAEQAFGDALPARDVSALGTLRDRLLTAWRALQPNEKDARKGRVLVQLRNYESTVHARVPSELALVGQYGL